MPGADRLDAARAVVWALSAAERCSLANAVTYMCLPSQVDPEVVDPLPISSSVRDVYDVDPDVEGERDLRDMKLLGEINVRLSLQAYFTAFRYKCVEYLVEAVTTTACVFNLALLVSNTTDEQPEILAIVDQLHSTIQSSEAQIEWIQCRIS